MFETEIRARLLFPMELDRDMFVLRTSGSAERERSSTTIRPHDDSAAYER